MLLTASCDNYPELTLGVAGSVADLLCCAMTTAIRGRTEPALKDNKRAYNESDWNETSTAEQEPYPYSKVQCAADC